MEKQLFEIDNTRYIWTQTQMLDFLPNNTLRESSYEKVCRVAFSHGINDCSYFREKNKDTNFLETALSIDIDDIKKFLLLSNNEHIKVFKISSIEKKMDFKKEYIGNSPQRIIYTISIKDSVFLPELPKGNQNMYNTLTEEEKNGLSYDEFLQKKAEMNKKRHYVGFLYTKNYLFGFFFGLLKYIKRDHITGLYHYGRKGFYCFFKGFNNNNYDFVICTDSYDICEDDYNVAFDNSQLIVP